MPALTIKDIALAAAAAAATVTGKRCWPRDESQIRFDPATKEDRNAINTILALEVAA